MSRQLIGNSVVLRPGYGGSPGSGEVLPVTHKCHPTSDIGATKSSLVDQSISSYPDSFVMYMSGFYGDYYNHVYIIPAALTLVNPVIGFGNKFLFWSTYFTDITLSTIVGINDLGLSFGVGGGDVLTIEGIKLTADTIIVGNTAPEEEIARYTFTYSNGDFTPWIVNLIRTNFVGVPPETPILEILKWKTDIIGAKDGTEQRIATMQFPRIEHQVNYLFFDDGEQNTIYDLLTASATNIFTYPLWAEQRRLLAKAFSGTPTLLLDTANFDIQEGDTVYLDDERGHVEQAQIVSISIDGITCSLAAGLQYDWTIHDHVYRLTEVRFPAKPELQRFPYNRLESKMTLRFTEFRDLFSADVSTLELGTEDLLTDRALTRIVNTLNGIPVINTRPIVDNSIKETFDWNFEVIDFETGAFDYATNQTMADVTYERKFLIRGLTQKFYWNWILKWLHGQRRPVWLPTWKNELGTQITTVSGHTVIIPGTQYLTQFPGDSSHRGIWFSYNGQWFPRAITDVSANGDGDTQITLSTNVPAGFPGVGPYEAGFLILARQGTDEVQKELHPFYSMLSTSFTGTKTSPEAP